MYQTVRGMRDFLPEKMKVKQFIEDTCRKAFEKYGFSPLQTPVVEEYATLSTKAGAGEEIKREIYYFKDQGERELGLRFDLTVPLARVVASNPELAKPFKRYQIGTVYRYDRPQAGRYREFTQADIDTVGTDSILADFECIAITAEIMQKLELNFFIRINNRILLEDIAGLAGIPEKMIPEAFRSIDKLDKIDWQGVEKELLEKKIDKKILSFIKDNDLADIEKMFKESKIESKGLNELKQLLELLKEQKLEKFIKIDLSLARGLEYYTGNVFEVMAESQWTVCAGGRYDNLVKALGGRETPAVGISFGVDRLTDILFEKKETESIAKIYLIPVNKELALNALSIAQKIRELEINVEMDLTGKGISKNLTYASKKKIPFTVIIGEDELKNNEIKLKNMKTGKESAVKLNELSKLKELIV